MGLNSSYRDLRNQMLTTDPLPSTNRAYYLIQQAENQRQDPATKRQVADGYQADFIFDDAEEAARDCQKISKLVHTTFYAMVVNETLELAIFSRTVVTYLKSALTGLRWFIFEAWLQLTKSDILMARQLVHAALGVGLWPVSGQEESTGSSEAPFGSNDKDD
ncbi:hypothetical protein Cgig2_005915 [Carnegiea gigantea]|uniref:Uncharacterized protein n=1 Tax=Carnegiea gigantea TaxID=171969 RepID=A0A9Q1Q8D9_9CARY|nr:hypothetical protein Cgig2_005915 [Carnegiea gigantea]